MTLRLFPNLTGLRGTERTIAAMRELVEAGKTDPKVVLKAHEIIRNIDRNDWYKIGSAIFQYVHDNIAYVRDPIGVEFVKSPAITLATRSGDCDDQSVVFSALAESIGLATRFKAIKADPKYPMEFTHVYSQANVPGRGWVTADTIVPQAKFGWEAENFPGRTWGGVNGMSFIPAATAGRLGNATFAAGSVSFREAKSDDTFGDLFGEPPVVEPDMPQPSGTMWGDEPMLTSGSGEIDTIVDADEDHWGGSCDTAPGPGFKSRMLAPGVGGANVLTMGDLGAGFFKKAAAALKKAAKDVGKAVQTNLNTLQKNSQKLLDKVGEGIGLSTSATREKASRDAVNQAMTTMWNSDGVQIPLEVLRRAEDVVKAQQEGRISQYVQGPPPAMQGYVGRFGSFGENVLKQAATAAVASAPWGAAVTAATGLLKSLGDAKDQEAAAKAIEQYVTAFPTARLEAASTALANAYVAAGGMMPSTTDKAPDAWVEQFRMLARAGKSEGMSGWQYWDMMYLVEAMERIVPSVQAAKQVLATAYQEHIQTSGQATITAAASVVEQAVAAGTVNAAEVSEALAITKKAAEGYALTADEQALAAKIAAGAKQASAGGKGWLLIPAAAAAAALLL
jgi:hypothetical protein